MSEKLIEQVRKYPCLYDMWSEEYRDKYKKEMSWRKVGDVMQRNSTTVKGDWKKLRDCFRAAITRRQTKNDQETLKPWRFEKQMEFLIPFMSSREMSMNLDDLQPGDFSDAGDGTISVKLEPVSAPASASASSESHKRRSNDSDGDDDSLTWSKCRRTDLDKDDVYYFFMSAAFSTRQLPRRLQTRIKQEVLEVLARAEQQFDCETPVDVSSHFMAS